MPAPEAIASLQRQFPGKVGQGKEFRGDYTIEVDREVVRAAAAYLKNELGFDFLVDISSVDNFGDEPRYEVVYEFCAFNGAHKQTHLRLKARVSEDDATIDSLVPVYQGADWHEREVFDMMGLKFNGHPDLRRILMWEGYPFHPLRKDFPLEGKPSNAPGEGFSRPAPMEGGPFVAPPIAHPPAVGDAKTTLHEPRANPAEHGEPRWD